MNPPADAETFSVNTCSGDGVDDAERSSDPGVNEEWLAVDQQPRTPQLNTEIEENPKSLYKLMFRGLSATFVLFCLMKPNSDESVVKTVFQQKINQHAYY